MTREPGTGRHGLVDALAAVVSDDLDVADALAHLVADVADLVGATAAALLALDGADMALLSATSHRAVELEMLQAQHESGPCVESVRTGHPVRSVGRDDLSTRWPEVGAVMVAAGFEAVESFPMRWRGATIGGLNLFYGAALPDQTDDAVKQAYADMATVVVAHSSRLSSLDVPTLLHDALGAREVVEQAKGVLAERHRVSMEEAYERLLDHAARTGDKLTTVAAAVVARTWSG